MNHDQAPLHPAGDEAEAAHALVHLREVLALVDRMAGDRHGASARSASSDQLEEGAALALGYANAPSIARRRFDALASEAAGFAAAGLGALIQHKERTGTDCAPAAQQLADEMRRSIDAMTIMIAPSPRRR